MLATSRWIGFHCPTTITRLFRKICTDWAVAPTTTSASTRLASPRANMRSWHWRTTFATLAVTPVVAPLALTYARDARTLIRPVSMRDQIWDRALGSTRSPAFSRGEIRRPRLTIIPGTCTTVCPTGLLLDQRFEPAIQSGCHLFCRGGICYSTRVRLVP